MAITRCDQAKLNSFKVHLWPYDWLILTIYAKNQMCIINIYTN